MTIIQMMLKDSENAIMLDRAAFNRYHQKEITLEECMERFYRNNNVPNQDKILTPQMFKEWLKGLGYGLQDFEE